MPTLPVSGPVRSGTSPAPDYGEAQSAESRRDFVHKMKIALKELRDTIPHSPTSTINNRQSSIINRQSLIFDQFPLELEAPEAPATCLKQHAAVTRAGLT